MSISLVGSVGSATSTTSPITGSYGQSPTAGNLLVAALTWADLTLQSFAPTTASAGWTRLISGAVGNNASGTSHAGVDFWYKVAAGGDGAPQFSQTSSGTFKLTCLIFELSGANTTAPLDTQGTPYQSGSTALTSSPTMTPVSAGNVAASGEYAISAFCQSNAASSTQTWTELGTYGSIYSDAATNSNAHTQCGSLANPSSGSTTSDSGHFSTGTANIYAAAQLVVIAAAVAATVSLTTDTLTLAAPSPSPLIGAHYPFKAALQADRWSATAASDRWIGTLGPDRWNAVLIPTA